MLACRAITGWRCMETVHIVLTIEVKYHQRNAKFTPKGLRKDIGWERARSCKAAFWPRRWDFLGEGLCLYSNSKAQKWKTFCKRSICFINTLFRNQFESFCVLWKKYFLAKKEMSSIFRVFGFLAKRPLRIPIINKIDYSLVVSWLQLYRRPIRSKLILQLSS